MAAGMLLAIGFGGGVLAGLLGVGGGFVMVPLQVLFTKATQRQANATSLAAIVPISLVGALVYYFGGARPSVDLPFAALLIIGSAVGAYFGVRLLRRVSERSLTVAVAVMLLAFGLKELLFP